MKIIKGDTVKILRGKDKGKSGKVEKTYPEDAKVLVAGINEFKRHIKARTRDQKSEIVTITKPVAISAVAIICGKCKKASRVGIKFEKGKKLRFCKNCKAIV